MIKNRISLSTILGWFILALSFLAGCFVFILIYEIENRDIDDSLYIILLMFVFLCLLAAITGIGLLRKKRWARITLLVVLYLGLIGWTGGIAFLIYNNGLPDRWREILGLLSFSFFVYTIFTALIFLLNNKNFKNEFPKKENELL